MQYLLSDIARKFNIPVSTLHYYEKEGALPFLRRSVGGYFLVDEADLTALYLLHSLRCAGCPVRMIVAIMKLMNDEKQRHGENGGSAEAFGTVLELLGRHTEELMKQQQLLLWQTQVTDYMKWLFFHYLQAGSSMIDPPPYPGTLPPGFEENVPQLDFENLLNAYMKKYASPEV